MSSSPKNEKYLGSTTDTRSGGFWNLAGCEVEMRSANYSFPLFTSRGFVYEGRSAAATTRPAKTMQTPSFPPELSSRKEDDRGDLYRKKRQTAPRSGNGAS